MSYKITILPIADLDIRENIKWYNEQKTGLGKQFYSKVKSRVSYIQKYPFSYQVKYRNTRSALIENFPFLIHYRIEEAKKTIVVLGVTRSSRDPLIWQNRD